MRKGWELNQLSLVCEFKSGTTISPHLEKSQGEILYLKVGDMNMNQNKVEINTSSRFVNVKDIPESQIIPIGATIFPKRGGAIATNKKRKIIKPTIIDLNCMAIIPSRIINQDYFYYWFQSIDLNEISNGTSVPQINNYSFDNIHIPYPHSLPEQKRIVAILDETFAAIDKAKANTEKNLQNAKDLFESYLQNVFTNPGEDWEEKKLNEVSEYDKTPNIRNDLPYVGLEHIESNSGKFLGTRNPVRVKSSTFYFTKEHLLYGRLRPYLNKVLLPDFDGHCSTEIFPIKVYKGLDKRFLYYWFTLSSTVKKIDATWTGARMPRANMTAVSEFTFFVPKLKEQLSIVKELDSLKLATKKLEFKYQQKLYDLEELKKSILQKAFAGEL